MGGPGELGMVTPAGGWGWVLWALDGVSPTVLQAQPVFRSTEMDVLIVCQGGLPFPCAALALRGF